LCFVLSVFHELEYNQTFFSSLSLSRTGLFVVAKRKRKTKTKRKKQKKERESRKKERKGVAMQVLKRGPQSVFVSGEKRKKRKNETLSQLFCTCLPG